MGEPWYALSIKQPWAGLIVAGKKTVEVRTWPTARRGPVLIHTGKIPDPRPEAWVHVTTQTLKKLCQVRGGIIGQAELVDCVDYSQPVDFLKDVPKHLNNPAWYQPGRMFGFRFVQARPVPFFPYKGNTVFFVVEGFQAS
jgi:hypothetical protein